MSSECNAAFPSSLGCLGHFEGGISQFSKKYLSLQSLAVSVVITEGGKKEPHSGVSSQPEAAYLGSLSTTPNRSARATSGEVGESRENKIT